MTSGDAVAARRDGVVRCIRSMSSDERRNGQQHPGTVDQQTGQGKFREGDTAFDHLHEEDNERTKGRDRAQQQHTIPAAIRPKPILFCLVSRDTGSPIPRKANPIAEIGIAADDTVNATAGSISWIENR